MTKTATRQEIAATARRIEAECEQMEAEWQADLRRNWPAKFLCDHVGLLVNGVADMPATDGEAMPVAAVLVHQGAFAEQNDVERRSLVMTAAAIHAIQTGILMLVDAGEMVGEDVGPVVRSVERALARLG